jgi:hypothetical protein
VHPRMCLCAWSGWTAFLCRYQCQYCHCAWSVELAQLAASLNHYCAWSVKPVGLARTVYGYIRRIYIYIRRIYTVVYLLKPSYPYPYPYKWVYTGPYIYGLYAVYIRFCSFWSSFFLAPFLTELFLRSPFLLMYMILH